MKESIPCTACGGPNEPLPGASQMACTYCGAKLIIPVEMRVKTKATAENKLPKSRPTSSYKKEAPDFLGKAQPFIIKAWNTYAAWTWIRWLLPTCLTVLVIGFVVCALLGALPFVLFR
jgi:DNA-directed RNA polymerase subunit RPC12/RpoP